MPPSGVVNERGVAVMHTTWRKPPRGGGLVRSRWRLEHDAPRGVWMLIDLRTGERRDFDSAVAAAAFLRVPGSES